jgi:hypothetical protein
LWQKRFTEARIWLADLSTDHRFSGLLIRVEIGHIRIGAAGNVRSK